MNVHTYLLIYFTVNFDFLAGMKIFKNDMDLLWIYCHKKNWNGTCKCVFVCVWIIHTT